MYFGSAFSGKVKLLTYRLGLNLAYRVSSMLISGGKCLGDIIGIRFIFISSLLLKDD